MIKEKFRIQKVLGKEKVVVSNEVEHLYNHILEHLFIVVNNEH